MKKACIIIAILISCTITAQEFPFERDWATYFGTKNVFVKDSNTDSQGNLFLVGIVNNEITNISATSNAHQTIYGGGGSDGFIAKIAPDGTLLWLSYYGGENIDAVYGITFDADDNFFLIGITFSQQNIATPNSSQPNINGASSAFITKFTNNGTQVWGTYYASNTIGYLFNSNDFYDIYNLHDFSIQWASNGFLYGIIGTNNTTHATANAFNEMPLHYDNSSYDLIFKFSDTGNLVWATYYGINNSAIRSIQVGNTGIYIAGFAIDCLPNHIPNTYFGTSNSHQPLPLACVSQYLSKFSFDGERLWSTYYGSTSGAAQTASKNCIAVFNDEIYLTSKCSLQNNFTTPGSFQEERGNGVTPYLSKFNSDGQVIWTTYLGNNWLQMSVYTFFETNRVSVDALGNIYVCGNTLFSQNMASVGSYQENITTSSDAFIVKFSPTGQRIWGTYYGGSQHEDIVRAHVVDEGTSFYLVGYTRSTENISTPNVYQEELLSSYNEEIQPRNPFIAKFNPSALSTIEHLQETVQVHPNPNAGSFYISTTQQETYHLKIYDAIGKMVYATSNIHPSTLIETGLPSGIYLLHIQSSTQDQYSSKKIVIK